MDRSMRVDFEVGAVDTSTEKLLDVISTDMDSTTKSRETTTVKMEMKPIEIPVSYWLLFTLFSLMAPLGIVLLRFGLARRHRAVHELIKGLVVLLVASLFYWSVGFSWSHVCPNEESEGILSWCSSHLASWTSPDSLQASMSWFKQNVAVMYVASLACFVCVNHSRLSMDVYLSLLISLIIFPVVHRTNYQDRSVMVYSGFDDQGAVGLLHLIGSTCGLVLSFVRLRFSSQISSYDLDSPDEASLLVSKSGHSPSYAFLGFIFHILGLIALQIVFSNRQELFIGVVGNCVLVTTSGGISSLVLNRVVTGKYSLFRLTSGMIAALVTCSSSVAVLTPWLSLFLGLLASVSYTLVRQMTLHWLRIDDNIDIISQHLVPSLISLLLVSIFNENTDYIWTLACCLMIFAFTLLIVLVAMLPVILCGCSADHDDHDEALNVREVIAFNCGHSKRDVTTWRPGAEVGESSNNPMLFNTLGTSIPEPLLASTSKDVRVPRLVIEQPTPLPMKEDENKDVRSPPPFASISKKPPLMSNSSVVETHNEQQREEVDHQETEVFEGDEDPNSDSRLRITRSAVKGQLKVLKPQDRLQRESFSTRRDITP